MSKQIEFQLVDRYGVLLSQSDLANLLGRSVAGLRYSLTKSSDPTTVAIRACSRRVGRRIYYPATDVARIIGGQSVTTPSQLG